MMILTILGVLAFVLSSTEGVTVTVDESCANNVATTFFANTATKPSGKQLNETCSATSECSQNYGPVVCANAMCKCAPGCSAYIIVTTYTGNNVPMAIYGCRLSPALYQTCTDECRWPLKCAEGSSYSTTLSPSPNALRPTPNPYGPPPKTCQCVEPLKQLPSGSCVRPCGENEVQLPTLECKPIVNVGDDCEASQQCSAQFSKCENKKCVCHEGLRADGGTCVIATARCEYGGDPLRPPGASSDAAPVSCTVRLSSAAGSIAITQVAPSSPLSSVASSLFTGPAGPMISDGCPSDHYCVPYETPVTSQSSGFCCPYPRPYCPIGQPHPSANCSVRSIYGNSVNGVPPLNPEDNPGICPADTHQCFTSTLLREAACCPRACPVDHVLVAQKCVPSVEVDGKCRTNEQCIQSNSDCINGVCTCPAKTIRLAGPTGKYECRPSCDSQFEIAINNRCQPRLKIGDQCRGQESRCPLTASCNSAGICQCSCGLVALDGKLCSQPPYCPPVKRTTGGTSYRPIGLPTKEELEKIVFCRTASTSMWAADAVVVEICPENQYCNYYTNVLGVCCEQPEPFCPYNENVYEKCDMQPITFAGGTTAAPTNCKADQFCYSYFSSSSNVTKTGVCCDKYVPPPPTTRIYPSPTTNNIIYQYTTPRPMPPMTPAIVPPGTPSVQILPAVAPAVLMTPGPSPVPVTGQ